tara:strand:- start:2038 stop:2748 length:711 start_codon:yes stop_codon:yes gene_type:complete
MTTTVANSKRKRNGRWDQMDAPYDIFSQPPLYKELYPNVSGSCRTFSIPICFRASSNIVADFNAMVVETEKWPKAFDGKTHKASYTVTQFMISTSSVEDPTHIVHPNNAYFDLTSFQRPYALAVQMSGPNTPLSSCKAVLAATPVTEECHVILAFPAPSENYNPWFRLLPAAPGLFSTPRSPNYNGSAAAGTFIADYPPPGLMRFALPWLSDMTVFQTLNGPRSVTFIKLMVTLLD